MSAPSDSAAPLPGEPKPQWRTAVTLLLFVHFFALGSALLSNSDSGESQLFRDVSAKTPGLDDYLTQLWINRPYDYHLMNDQTLDFDHHLEAEIHYADGRPNETVTLPPPGTWPGERRQRFQQLAWYIDRAKALAEGQRASEVDEELKALIPGAVGAGLLRQHPGAAYVVVKCIVHHGLSPLQLQSTIKSESDPNDPQYFETVSNVTVLLGKGRPEVFENLPLPEVAPVHKATSSAAKLAPQSKEQ